MVKPGDRAKHFLVRLFQGVELQGGTNLDIDKIGARVACPTHCSGTTGNSQCRSKTLDCRYLAELRVEMHLRNLQECGFDQTPLP